MSNLIRPEDLDGFPRDPVDTFVHLERLARERYEDAVMNARSSYNDNSNANQFEYDYMSAVLAVATVYGIEELSKNWELPRLNEEDWWEQCRNFRGAAQHVSVKLLLHQARKRDTYSVALDAPTKLKLQHYVQQGRNLIAKVDLTVPKRERLLACLNAFQVELDRERTGLQVFGALACELASYASEAAGKLDGVVRVVERIGNALGLSRQAEDERERGKRLPAPDTKQIEPPKRKPEPRRPVFDKKIDDEIPF